MGPDVVLVSSADETAFEVRAALQGSHQPPREGEQPAHRFMTSGDERKFRRLGARFLGPEVDAVEAWSW